MAEFCNVCQHTGWVQVDRATREPCACYEPAARKLFTSAKLRAGDDWYDPEYDKYSPWPLRSLLVSGVSISLRQFRHMAWRSIVPHWRSLTYEIVSPKRLIAVQFGEDPSDDTGGYQLAAETGLVVFTLLPAAPNRSLGPMVAALISEREMLGKPTWVYQSVFGASLGTMYGEDLQQTLQLLGAPRTSLC